VVSPATGYVTLIDREALQCCAEEGKVRLAVCAPAGQMVARGEALAWLSEPVEEDCRKAIAAAFVIEDQRNFDHDPRFGMVVLAEIGSRALSPAVNDPGTAIAALNAGQRVLETISDWEAKPDSCPRVANPPLAFEAMVEDLLRPIARDGAAIAEVGIRIQQMLGAVAAELTPASGAMRRLADEALDRVGRADIDPTDRERIDRARREAFP
jgi:uncharacterized membrane protein